MKNGKSTPRFDAGIILGDPFALVTLSIATLGWLIAFIATIAADAKGSFPNIGWWTVIYELLVVAGIAYVMIVDAINEYRLAMIGFIAVMLAYSTNAVNILVYSASAAEQASAAGHLLLSIIAIIWMFYFGTTPNARPHALIDSFSLHRGEGGEGAANNYRGANGNMSNGNYSGYNNSYARPQDGQPQRPQMYTSAQLSGFESTWEARNAFGSQNHREVNPSSPGHSPVVPTDSQTEVPIEYPYKAKAIYSYEANPEDANEISFSKGEILDVSDISGRWWQARRTTGESGIAPSNYLALENADSS